MSDEVSNVNPVARFLRIGESSAFLGNPGRMPAAIARDLDGESSLRLGALAVVPPLSWLNSESSSPSYAGWLPHVEARFYF